MLVDAGRCLTCEEPEAPPPSLRAAQGKLDLIESCQFISSPVKLNIFNGHCVALWFHSHSVFSFHTTPGVSSAERGAAQDAQTWRPGVVGTQLDHNRGIVVVLDAPSGSSHSRR